MDYNNITTPNILCSIIWNIYCVLGCLWFINNYLPLVVTLANTLRRNTKYILLVTIIIAILIFIAMQDHMSTAKQGGAHIMLLIVQRINCMHSSLALITNQIKVHAYVNSSACGQNSFTIILYYNKKSMEHSKKLARKIISQALICEVNAGQPHLPRPKNFNYWPSHVYRYVASLRMRNYNRSSGNSKKWMRVRIHVIYQILGI